MFFNLYFNDPCMCTKIYVMFFRKVFLGLNSPFEWQSRWNYQWLEQSTVYTNSHRQQLDEIVGQNKLLIKLPRQKKKNCFDKTKQSFCNTDRFQTMYIIEYILTGLMIRHQLSTSSRNWFSDLVLVLATVEVNTNTSYLC